MEEKFWNQWTVNYRSMKTDRQWWFSLRWLHKIYDYKFENGCDLWCYQQYHSKHSFHCSVSQRVICASSILERLLWCCLKCRFLASLRHTESESPMEMLQLALSTGYLKWPNHSSSPRTILGKAARSLVFLWSWDSLSPCGCILHTLNFRAYYRLQGMTHYHRCHLYLVKVTESLRKF